MIVPEELRNPSPPIEINHRQTIKTEDEVLKTIGALGKVTAGVTVGVTAMSVILPLALTCIVLGAVGFIMFFVFSGIKSSPLVSVLQTDVPVIFTQVPTDTPIPALTPIDTPIPFTKILLKDDFTNRTGHTASPIILIGDQTLSMRELSILIQSAKEYKPI